VASCLYSTAEFAPAEIQFPLPPLVVAFAIIFHLKLPVVVGKRESAVRITIASYLVEFNLFEL
jgi:hypothetical protein